MFKAEQREFIKRGRGQTRIYTGREVALKAEAGTGSSGHSSDELHLGIGVHCHHVVALGWLDARLGVALTVEPLVQKEVTALLKVQAAVAAHKALGVVELVPRLDDGASDGETGRGLLLATDGFGSMLPSRTSGGARGVPGVGIGEAGEGTHTIPWPQRVHSGSPCRPLSGVPSLLAVGLRLRGPLDPGRSPESRSASGMSQVQRSERRTSLLRSVGWTQLPGPPAQRLGMRFGGGRGRDGGRVGIRTEAPRGVWDASKRRGWGRWLGCRKGVGSQRGGGRAALFRAPEGVVRHGARWQESYRLPRPPACPASSGRSLTAWAPKSRAQPAPAASCTPLSPGPLRSHGSVGDLWLCPCWAKEMHQRTQLWHQPSICQLRSLVRFFRVKQPRPKGHVSGVKEIWD